MNDIPSYERYTASCGKDRLSSKTQAQTSLNTSELLIQNIGGQVGDLSKEVNRLMLLNDKLVQDIQVLNSHKVVQDFLIQSLQEKLVGVSRDSHSTDQTTQLINSTKHSTIQNNLHPRVGISPFTNLNNIINSIPPITVQPFVSNYDSSNPHQIVKENIKSQEMREMNNLREEVTNLRKEKGEVLSRLDELQAKYEEQHREHAREIAQLKSNMFNSVVDSENQSRDSQELRICERKQMNNLEFSMELPDEAILGGLERVNNLETSWQYERQGEKKRSVKRRGEREDDKEAEDTQLVLNKLVLGGGGSQYFELEEVRKENDLLKKQLRDLKSKETHEEKGELGDEGSQLAKIMRNHEEEMIVWRRKTTELESELKKMSSLNRTLQSEIVKLNQRGSEGERTSGIDEKTLENLFDSDIGSDSDDLEDDGYGDKDSKQIRKHRQFILNTMTPNERIFNNILYLKRKIKKLEDSLTQWKRQYWQLEKSNVNCKQHDQPNVQQQDNETNSSFNKLFREQYQTKNEQLVVNSQNVLQKVDMIQQDLNTLSRTQSFNNLNGQQTFNNSNNQMTVNNVTKPQAQMGNMINAKTEINYNKTPQPNRMQNINGFNLNSLTDLNLENQQMMNSSYPQIFQPLSDSHLKRIIQEKDRLQNDVNTTIQTINDQISKGKASKDNITLKEGHSKQKYISKDIQNSSMNDGVRVFQNYTIDNVPPVQLQNYCINDGQRKSDHAAIDRSNNQLQNQSLNEGTRKSDQTKRQLQNYTINYGGTQKLDQSTRQLQQYCTHDKALQDQSMDEQVQQLQNQSMNFGTNKSLNEGAKLLQNQQGVLKIQDGGIKYLQNPKDKMLQQKHLVTQQIVKSNKSYKNPSGHQTEQIKSSLKIASNRNSQNDTSELDRDISQRGYGYTNLTAQSAQKNQNTQNNSYLPLTTAFTPTSHYSSNTKVAQLINNFNVELKKIANNKQPVVNQPSHKYKDNFKNIAILTHPNNTPIATNDQSQIGSPSFKTKSNMKTSVSSRIPKIHAGGAQYKSKIYSEYLDRKINTHREHNEIPHQIAEMTKSQIIQSPLSATMVTPGKISSPISQKNISKRFEFPPYLTEERSTITHNIKDKFNH